MEPGNLICLLFYSKHHNKDAAEEKHLLRNHKFTFILIFFPLHSLFFCISPLLLNTIYFWKCNFITFLPSVSSLQILPWTTLLSQVRHLSLFFSANSYCIRLIIWICTSKYNLLSLDNGICMYVFRSDYFELGSQLVFAFSLGRPPLQFPAFLTCL